MKQPFEYWEKQFKSESLSEFNTDREGLLWLKIKSIIRPELMNKFLEENESIQISASKQHDVFITLYDKLSQDVEPSHSLLDNFIRKISKQQVDDTNIDQLVTELYKLPNFEWGGDYQNSLDKYLVSRYVKTKDASYDKLVAKFDTEINSAVRGYVLNSWYNYWSSVLIENIFKSHQSVLPTIGLVKSVDFFINDIPFDLKVTYFPSEYLKLKRKGKGFPVELTFLKQQAKVSGIENISNYDKQYALETRMRDKNDEICQTALSTIKRQNKTIIKEAIDNPKELVKWLYENQGEMRFGAENRIFLVLVDSQNLSKSWQLKRNIDLLRPKINSYLDNFNNKKLDDMKLTFEYKDKPNPFTVYGDILFITTQSNEQ